jgi:hypothetical protein
VGSARRTGRTTVLRNLSDITRCSVVGLSREFADGRVRRDLA